MPLRKGSSPSTISTNIKEFHTGPTYAHTLAKFGKKKANAQAIAVALHTARKSKRYADGGDVPDDDIQPQGPRGIPVITVRPKANTSDLQAPPEGVIPKQKTLPPLPPSTAQNIINRYVEGPPAPNVNALKQQGYSDQDIADLQGLHEQQGMVGPPKIARQVGAELARPYLEAGETIGGAMSGTEPASLGKMVTDVGGTLLAAAPFPGAAPEKAAAKIAKDVLPENPAYWDEFEKELAKILGHSPETMYEKVGPLAAMKQHPESWIDSSQFEKIGEQAGSNPGGMYRDPNTGDRWYIKKPKSVDHLKNEILAAKLYQLAGVSVPDVRHTTLKIGNTEYPALASPIIGGHKLGDFATVYHPPAGLKENFPIDAWLANWDAVGTGKDNVIVDPEYNAHRIDMGGALLYRAQGAPKGKAFGNDVPELKTMLDPNKSPDAAEVFQGADSADVGWDAAQRLAAINPSDLAKTINKWGPGNLNNKQDLYDTLMARRKAVIDHYVQQSESAAPKAAAAEPESVSQEQISKIISGYDSPQNAAQALIAFAQAGHGEKALAAKLALPAAQKKAVNKTLWEMKKHPILYDPEIIDQLYANKPFPKPPKGEVESENAFQQAFKDYDKEIEEYYQEMDDQDQKQYELAQGISKGEKDWYDMSHEAREARYKQLSKNVDWQNYTPPKVKTYSIPQLANANPVDLSKLGFNIKLQLYKGGIEGYHGELFDPAEGKDFEKAFFLADSEDVAKGYGYPEPFVARAPKAKEIDWTELIHGAMTPENRKRLEEYYGTSKFGAGYAGNVMKSLIDLARKEKLDLLIIHNISDVTGSYFYPHTQYAFLNTAGTLRHIEAKFDPDKLHLAHTHWGLMGGGLLTYGALQGADDAKAEPMVKRASGGSTPFHLRGYQESIGAPTASSEPGVRHFTTPHTGMIHSQVPGRTDKISMNVKGGSYILPADIVSGVGQGNSMAGAQILNHFFKMGPYGAATSKIATPKPNFGKPMRPIQPAIRGPYMRMQMPKFAEGGQEQDDPGSKVPIVAAGGEFAIPPEVVQRLGGGNMKKGHEILDHFVLHIRRKTVKDIKGLKPPKK